MNEVIDFPENLTNDVPAEKVLEEASAFVKGGDLVILGETEDGDQFMFGTSSSPETIMWQLEMAKYLLLTSTIDIDFDDS